MTGRLNVFRRWLADIITPAHDHARAEWTRPIERQVHTLDHWRSLLAFPKTIECSQMELLGRDHEEPLFVGPGRIEIRSETDIRFFVYASASDPSLAALRLMHAQRNPYDVEAQFRLFATDYRGTEWGCGYTPLEFFADHNHGWPLGGQIDGMHALAKGAFVSTSSSVELLFVPPIELPTAETLKTIAQIGDERIFSSSARGRQKLDLLGSEIAFSYEPSGEALWVTASTASGFNHPFAENWLSEPLRILLGTPVYPRLVARNMGDGTAQVWLRPSPRQKRPSVIGLQPPFTVLGIKPAEFWQLYGALLNMIAKAGGFEAHEVTRFYDELADAQHGSRWVLTMTLANVAEALADSLMEDTDRRSEYSDDALASMKKHIKAFSDHDALRGRMLSNLGMVSKRSVVAFMRGLGASAVVNPDHVQTWYAIRNSVMHGNLVDPWSSEEGDGHLREMLDLVHALTRERVRRA
ncbi:hypothetical protein [Sphingobium cupriresistens]|uniref:hypothetical protein n=1 Tax=Sphingobium cupriresistens TaxID=1132417 RepID=UPI003BF48E31